jgi:hypothetical protein
MPRLALLTAVILLVAVDRADAWNNVGHHAIAKLAYDRLGDGVKAKLFAILKSHPHYEQYLAAHRPVDVPEIEWVIIRSSVWPDWVRPRGAKDPRGPEVTKYHRGEEHYINVPLIQPKDEAWAAKRTLVDPDLANILSALRQRCNDLKTQGAAAQDRAIAICWIFHLVGDIHQPLHNVAYFSDTKEFFKGDLGGNLFGVRVLGQKTKLHAYWDNLFGDDPNYADDSAEHQAKIFREGIKMAEMLRGVELPAGEREKLEKNRTFASWSQEGFELAKKAYQKADGSGLLEGAHIPFNGPIPETAPEVGEDYARAARAIAEVRAVLAGARLAERITLLRP